MTSSRLEIAVKFAACSRMGNERFEHSLFTLETAVRLGRLAVRSMGDIQGMNRQPSHDVVHARDCSESPRHFMVRQKNLSLGSILLFCLRQKSKCKEVKPLGCLRY